MPLIRRSRLTDRRQFLRQGGQAGIAAVWSPDVGAGRGPVGPFLDVRTFGAIGDGRVDDTSAINRAFAKLAESGGSLVLTPGTYRVSGGLAIADVTGAAILGYGATLALDPTARFGLELTGKISRLTIQGLRIVGTGEVRDDQCGIGTRLSPPRGTAITDLRVVDCEVGNVVRGLCLDTPAAAEPRTHSRVWLQGNYVHDVMGTTSGEGYGIVLSACWYGRIAGNHVDRVQRHSIYNSACRGTVIEGNTIRRHRDGMETEAHSSAVVTARSSYVSITDNLFEGCADTALSIEPHETDSRVESRGISVIGNKFVESVHRDIVVGSFGPATSGPLTDVVIAENFFDRPASATNVHEFVRVLSGKRVRISGNQFLAGAPFTRHFSCIVLAGTPEVDHIDDVAIEGNSAVARARGDGSLALIELGGALCSAEQHVRAAGNDVCFDADRASVVHYAAAITSVPLQLAQPSRPIRLPFARVVRTPADQSSHFQLRLADGGECTMESPDNAVAGMTLRYDFTNSAGKEMPRLHWSRVFRLARRFAPPAAGTRSTISFYYDGVDWIETGRASV